MDIPDDLLRLTRRLRLNAHERVQPVNWRPPADVYRTPEGWLIKVEIAGVRKEEVEVSLHGCYLCIRGRRRDTVVTERREFYSMEIAYSRFERAIHLPCDLGSATAETGYRDGMLLVRIITEESGR